jgi:hypothetical protein
MQLGLEFESMGHGLKSLTAIFNQPFPKALMHRPKECQHSNTIAMLVLSIIIHHYYK